VNTITNKQGKIKIFEAKGIAQIGVLSAIATILMLFEVPLWFAPSFYKVDLSELPVLIGSFAIGPMAGVIIELIKVLLNLLVNGTTTAGVGEAANFVIGCAMVVPAAIIYKMGKSKSSAIIGLGTGTAVMTIVGSLMNAFIILPVYAKAFNMPIAALIGMGSAINPAINSLSSFVLFAVAPFNLLKGVVVSIITILIYKKISPILHNMMGKR